MNLLKCAHCDFDQGMHPAEAHHWIDQDGEAPLVHIVVRQDIDSDVNTLMTSVVLDKDPEMLTGARSREMCTSMAFTCENCHKSTKVAYSFHKGTIEIDYGKLDVSR